jgi:hypothetical protein
MTGPDPEEILKAWKPFKKALGVTSVRTEREYARARATMDALLDEIGDDERHPLAEVLGYLADRIRAYEEEHVRISDADPGEVLRLLMEQRAETGRPGRLRPAEPDLGFPERQTRDQQGRREEACRTVQCARRSVLLIADVRNIQVPSAL